MLLNYAQYFKDKEVGLVLFASPSIGSKLADAVGGLTSFYNNQLGLRLKWGNDFLKDLDDRFNEALDRGLIPKMTGIEACENHFILHRKWIPGKRFVVERESAGRYFSIRMLADTDHFSIVKPTGLDHPAHKLLVEFWLRHYGPPFVTELRVILDASRESMRERNLPYFTPSLLLALLEFGGFTSSVLNSVRPGLARQLADDFVRYVNHTLPATEPGPFVNFDWLDRREVQLAQQIATEERTAVINERTLLRAILLSGSTTVKALKERLGTDFDKILAETDARRTSGPLTPGY